MKWQQPFSRPRVLSVPNPELFRELSLEEFTMFLPPGIPCDDVDSFDRLSGSGYILHPSPEIVKARRLDVYQVDNEEPWLPWYSILGSALLEDPRYQHWHIDEYVALKRAERAATQSKPT